MAGCYQTTGERANEGTGAGNDTGGGWINGCGDESMTMLHGYERIIDFFTGIEWWKLNPNNELATYTTPITEEANLQPWFSNKVLCLAEPGRQYVVYLPKGGSVKVQLAGGPYRVSWYNPRTGAHKLIMNGASGPVWTSPVTAGAGDWVLYMIKNSQS